MNIKKSDGDTLLSVAAMADDAVQRIDRVREGLCKMNISGMHPMFAVLSEQRKMSIDIACECRKIINEDTGESDWARRELCSSGPFRFDAGGGKRNIRKGHEFS